MRRGINMVKVNINENEPMLYQAWGCEAGTGFLLVPHIKNSCIRTPVFLQGIIIKYYE
jgi:hypothetical protein